MTSASDRFQIVETILVAPGVCRVCGGVNKDWYVDFGYNEEFYGAVYFCNECVGAMAAACGFLTPAEKINLELELTEAHVEVYKLRVRSDGLEKALDGLRSAGFLVSRDLDGPDDDLPLLDEADEVASDGGESIESTPGDDLGAGEGAAVEPVDEPGVADLRSDAGPTGPKFELSL
jgi:hypothetical protein